MTGNSSLCHQEVRLSRLTPLTTKQDPGLVSGALIQFLSSLSPSCLLLWGTDNLPHDSAFLVVTKAICRTFAVSIASILEQTLSQEMIILDGILTMSWDNDKDFLEWGRAAFVCTKKLMFL